MEIWYVHGAGASERSFNWLKENLPEHSPKFVTYDVKESVTAVAERLHKKLNTAGKNSILLGHSLGGIVATACADHPNVHKLITISAPFGGVKQADFMSMFSFEPLFHDLRRYSQILTSIRNKKITKSHLAIVGSSGLPFTNEINDGVLTLESQTYIDTICKVFPLNHFEVLLSPEVASLISKFVE